MRLATPTNGSPMRARRTHAHVLRPCARACARVRSGAHASAPNRASAFRRRGPRVARLAGVQLCGGVQREHRRVEHCVGQLVARGMRRLSGPGGAPPQAGRARRVVYAARAVVRGGTADARARVCAQTCGHAHARVSLCASIAARTKAGIYDCIYVCVFYVYVCIIHICVCICALV